MNIENWMEIGRIVVDLLKTIIPFALIYYIVFLFKKEIKVLMKGGGLKLSAPGFSVETIKNQRENPGREEKREIESLNTELKMSRVQAKKTSRASGVYCERQGYILFGLPF